jgi:hypothetical protein
MDQTARIDDVSNWAELPTEPASAASLQTLAERDLIEIG